jgi:hypothetical protein
MTMSTTESPRAKRNVRKTLQAAEWVFLDAVCRTGGGGTKIDTKMRSRMAGRLATRGLVIQKPGATDPRIIHSTKGRAYWLQLQSEGVI